MQAPPAPIERVNPEIKKYQYLDELIHFCLKPYRADRIKNADDVLQWLRRKGPAERKTAEERYGELMAAGANAELAGNLGSALSYYQRAKGVLSDKCNAPGRHCNVTL